MQWDKYDSDAVEKFFGCVPGGISFIDMVVEELNLGSGQSVLDLNPSFNGCRLACMIADEFGVEVSCLVPHELGDEAAGGEVEEVSGRDRVRVVRGAPESVPLSSGSCDRMYFIGSPFVTLLSLSFAKEAYRILKAGGILAIGGPFSLSNKVPSYMEEAVREIKEARLGTPAALGLKFCDAGFFIWKAEFVDGAWDLLKEWLEKPENHRGIESFVEGVKKDEGRWVSLGILVLKKPFKPSWAP